MCYDVVLGQEPCWGYLECGELGKEGLMTHLEGG